MTQNTDYNLVSEPLKDSYFLRVPKGFYNLTPRQKKEICNGMGPSSLPFVSEYLIPDTFLGLDMKRCGDIHDYMYHKGKTKTDKVIADNVFLANMMNTINAHSGNFITRSLRSTMALKYYRAVHEMGDDSFK